MFSTGNFSSFASLKSSVETALQANGWTLSSGVLSKSGMFIKLTATAEELVAEAGTGAASGDITGAAPTVKIMSFASSPINFPGTYDLHILDTPDEIYLVVNYNSDKYQQLSWGKSRVEQVGGTGMWVTGSFNGLADPAGDQRVYLQASYSYVGTGYSGMGCGLFFEYDNVSTVCSHAHTGLDTAGWKSSGWGDGSLMGSGNVMAGLLQSLPSQFNQNTILLPLLAVQRRLSNGSTIVVDAAHARLCRNDNQLSGEIVSYGGDDWKVYPLHRKNADVRNGVPWSTGADHSGTFGFAVRYTG